LRDLLVARTVPRSRAVAIFARFLVSPEYLAREPGAFERWLARSGPPGTRILLRQLAAIVRHATESRLSRIAAPTLVVTGDLDRLVPVENSRRLARAIRGARLVELAGAGHCFPLERPAETVKALADHFLPSW
jgi:pimeloyl-ACP methyl ester carboxylesterase